MNRIEDSELKNINGGMSGWLAFGIGVLVTFVSGVIDGIARPKGCRE